MKIDTSWNENIRVFIYLALFFAITGGIRWYSGLDDSSETMTPQPKSQQTGEFMITDEDF